jgi:hypothetical protein
MDKENQAVLHPEVVKLCPSLSALNQQELVYIILAYDYNSPYKQFPEHERNRKAMIHAFDDFEDELVKSPRLVIAAQDYVSLQYNPLIETARVYQQKIDKFQQQLLVDESPAQSKKIGDAIDDMTKRIATLQKDYEVQQQKQGEIKGKMQLSHIEKLMSNRKQFLSITQNK